MDLTPAIPVPSTMEQIGTLRLVIGPELTDAALVASGSIVSEFEDQYLAELTDAVEQSLRSLRQMVIQRLRARATIVKPIAASASQFMNPWHDEIGRFAEKGTGTNYASIASRARQAEAAGSQISELDAESAIALHKRLTDFAAEMGYDFEADQGVKLTKAALAQRHGSGIMNGLAATDADGNVLGAIAYTKHDGEYHIEFLGSTGLVKGVGSQLVIPVMEQAAADGADVSLQVASGSRSAGPFWDSVGFTGGIGSHRLMPLADVKAWVANVAHEREGVLVGAGPPPSDDWDPDDDRWAAHATELGLIAPIVASAAQFMNPWHDEIGRFAPKGTGSRAGRLGPKALNEKLVYDQVHLRDRGPVESSLEEFAARSTEQLAKLLPDEPLTVELESLKRTATDNWDILFMVRDEAGNDVARLERLLELHAADGPTSYAAGLYVAPNMQGKGIGTVLQDGFEDWSASQGIDRAELYAVDIGTYAWMRAGYDWADTDNFDGISRALRKNGHDDIAQRFRDSKDLPEIPNDLPTPYELTKLVPREDILDYVGSWDGVKPLRTDRLPLVAAAAASRQDRLEPVRQAWDIWARQYPAAAEGYVVDPEAEAAWEALMSGDGLVAAGPFDLNDFNVMTPEEWAAAFDVEAADIVGDVVVDAATGQALRPGLNVTDKVITDLIDKHVGRLQDLGPYVQTSLRDALELAVTNQLSLDEVVREIQATGPLGETAARSIARTELTAATNGGMLTGWKRDGFPFKQWVSLHDERVRHAHAEADGQTVPTEQEFEVAGFAAQYPGDPRLPIHLRINCRCYMDRIGEDGQTLNTRLADATRPQLYRLAQELQIPGRSKMRKDELFQAIDRYRNGFGFTSLEEMTRAQLLIRARAAGIVGRYRMTKPELMIRLRDLSTGRNRDRWLIDAGHGTREQLAAVQDQLRADIAALHQGPLIGAGPPPNAEKTESIRRKVFRRYGGADTGTAFCVGCGARLHWSNNTRWEQMTLIRIDPKLTWSSKNAMPVCLADAAKLSKLTADKISTTFTIDTSWEAITQQFTLDWDSILVRFAVAEFMNPWHDALGRFAPKGYGTDRVVHHEESTGTYSVETADGKRIDMIGDGADELTDEQRSDALNAVADSWDIAPLAEGQPPHIEVHASDHNALDVGAGSSDVLAWVTARDPTVINMIGSRAEWDAPYDTHQPMPSERQISKIRYTATHEYGHLYMYANQMDEWHNVINTVSKRETRDALSEYGRSTPVEAYAEAWAEYFGTAGTTLNTAALNFAAALGWRQQLPGTHSLAASPGGAHDNEIPIAIYETPNGPILEYADGTIRKVEIGLTASAGQFANPWHDEEGKFAPKGTGTKYDAGSVKARVKAAQQAGAQVDRVGDPQRELETLDAWADKMGGDFPTDEGVGMMREALNDVNLGSKALISKTKNGIGGIISYDYDPATKTYMIHHLGSSGIAKGVGTQLAAQVMVQAATNGAGVEFEAAQNDSAPEFWSSLGFDVTDPKHVVMSASDVGAWMRDFTG